MYQLARLLSRHWRPCEPWVASLVSVGVDVDHFVDKSYFACTHDRFVQIVPLHSWELMVVLLASRSARARSVGVGLLVHFVMDATVGGYRARELSLLYRLSRRFRTGYLGDWVMWPHGPRGFGEIFHSGSTPETDG